MQKRAKRVSVAIIGVAIATLIGCSSQESDSIKIALVGPTTGPVAQYGDMQMTPIRWSIRVLSMWSDTSAPVQLSPPLISMKMRES